MVMLTRWNPTTNSGNLGLRMERLFDEMLGSGLWRDSEERPLRGTWMPAMNILEENNAVLITADLPGLKPEDVEVTVDEGTLTIRGERKLEEAAEGETYHRVERRYGLFERTFNLPTSIDSTKRLPRVAGSCPSNAISSVFQPGVIPRAKRLSLRSASAAVCLATVKGSRMPMT